MTQAKAAFRRRHRVAPSPSSSLFRTCCYFRRSQRFLLASQEDGSCLLYILFLPTSYRTSSGEVSAPLGLWVISRASCINKVGKWGGGVSGESSKRKKEITESRAHLASGLIVVFSSSLPLLRPDRRGRDPRGRERSALRGFFLT